MVRRRYAGALRGLRLARGARRRRSRCRCHRSRATSSARIAEADAHLLQDGDRQGRAHDGGHARRARRAARCERGRRDRKALDWPHAPFEIPDVDPASLGCTRRRRGSRSGLDAALCRLSRGLSRASRRVRTPRSAAHCLLAGAKQRCALVADANREAQSIATRKASQNVIEATCPRVAGVARRIGGPDGLEPYALERRGHGAARRR